MSVKTRMLSRRVHHDQIREERQRRRSLESEIAMLSSAADRADFEAMLARYDDSITIELHDILVNQVAQGERVTNRPWRPVGGL